MNEALLSSKNMNWCTPQDFFDRLNAEFDFTLDAAATDKSAKCKKYYTPETDGLKQPWTIGGLYSATRRMVEVLAIGWKRLSAKQRAEQQLFFLSPPEPTQGIFTNTSTGKRKYAFYGAG